VHAGAPVVELLPQLEVQEALGRDHVGKGADPVRDVEQRAAVGADELHEHVELPGGDDDVRRFVPAGDLLGDLLRRPGGADPDHCLGLEAEPERVRDPGHLEDVVLTQPGIAGADRRLRDAERGGDAAEGLAAVHLQRFDDPLVDRVDATGAAHGPARSAIGPDILAGADAAHCAVFLITIVALRQSGAGSASKDTRTR